MPLHILANAHVHEAIDVIISYVCNVEQGALFDLKLVCDHIKVVVIEIIVKEIGNLDKPLPDWNVVVPILLVVEVDPLLDRS